MGLILDTSLLIAGERRGDTVAELLLQVRNAFQVVDVAVSAMSVVELTHGIYRARTETQRHSRRMYATDLFDGIIVHPVSLEIAELAGRIEGEQANRGYSIAIEDLLIGATALYIGFGVATLNAKHFELIPDLQVLSAGYV